MDVLCPILTIAVKTADYIIDSERSAMKKLKILTIVIAFLVCLTGCQSLLSNINAYLYADTYDADKYVEQYSNSWHYKQLDASMKEFYGGMYTAVTDTVNTDALVEFKDAKGNIQSTDGVRVRFSGAKLTDGDVELLFEAFFRDNPQFFYLNREYRVEGRSIDGENLYDTIILQYLFPLVERRETIQTFNSAIASMLEGAPQGADQYDTELYLYDRLAKHCTYNEAAAKTDADDNPMAYTAYGAVVKGSAVCEGYAKAISQFDLWLPKLEAAVKEDDIVIITADHGCDPASASSDHTREYIPIFVYGSKIKPVDIGVRKTFADIGATISEILNVGFESFGKSFYSEMIK